MKAILSHIASTPRCQERKYAIKGAVMQII